MAGFAGPGHHKPGTRNKAPTVLEQLLEEINFQRTKEMRQLLKDDSGFVMLQGTTYWTDLFVRHFLLRPEHTIDSDDLLFFVRKKHVKATSKFLPKFETDVEVFRRDSKKLPIGDPDVDWEETVYLNLVVHQFDYTLTLAICTRTSPKELQVLRRHSQKVYASPSRRRMDAKGDLEEMTYPHICFMVDNFDEVFCDILVRDGEMVCVELVASDRDGTIQGVIFLGSIRYDALKKVYDARSSISTKMAQRMTFGLFSSAAAQRVEFVKMKGPQGKGHAEMAVTKPKGSGAETPTSEPGYCVTDALWDADWDDAEEIFMYRHQRRLSDPSSNLNNFVRGGWKTKPDSAASKARSENEGLDSMANGVNEIEAGDVRDDAQEVRASVGPESRPPGVNRGGSISAQSSPTFARRRAIMMMARHQTGNRYPGASPSSVISSPILRHPGMAQRGKSPFEAISDAKRQQQQQQHQAQQHQAQSIEVGSETLLWPPNGLASQQPTPDEDDRILRSKIDRGAILVQGEEELPLLLNRELINDKEFKIPSHIAERRRIRSRSLVPDNARQKQPGSPEDQPPEQDDNGNDSAECQLQLQLQQQQQQQLQRGLERSATLPRRRGRKSGSLGNPVNPLPPHRVTPDGTAIYYWCELPRAPSYQELDDGAYNPLWTMRGFTQTFHFWKETKRAQSVPLNAFLTYITLPWWSIAKDVLDHREGPILTF